MALQSHADDNDGTTSTATARLPESNSNDQPQLSRIDLSDSKTEKNSRIIELGWNVVRGGCYLMEKEPSTENIW